VGRARERCFPKSRSRAAATEGIKIRIFHISLIWQNIGLLEYLSLICDCNLAIALTGLSSFPTQADCVPKHNWKEFTCSQGAELLVRPRQSPSGGQAGLDPATKNVGVCKRTFSWVVCYATGWEAAKATPLLEASAFLQCVRDMSAREHGRLHHASCRK
jgi:hypothetical protein